MENAKKAKAPERKTPGHPLGVQRVLDSKASLPQAAQKIDNSLPIYSNEILIKVERLNIDAASFVQMEQVTGKNPQKIAEIVVKNTKERGKQENAETGSGGMLVGKVEQRGSQYKGPLKAKVGDRIATLVSLTLTPLQIERVLDIDLATHQIEVEGHAILFERSIAARIPADLEERLAMAIFDVAGAPATVNAICKPGQTVVVIGAGGKAGLLSVAAARKRIGKNGRLIAIEPFAKAAETLKRLKACDHILQIDATDPIAVEKAVSAATKGKFADVVVNVASVSGTENSALLSVKQKGKVLFFSMATSFAKVALGAEGVATGATLLFGNGYFPGHADYAIDLVRKNKVLKAIFSERYSK